MDVLKKIPHRHFIFSIPKILRRYSLIAERKTNLTWDRIRDTMNRLHLIDFFSKDGRVLQTTEPTPEQVNILNKLKISIPKRIQTMQTNLKFHSNTTKNHA